MDAHEDADGAAAAASYRLLGRSGLRVSPMALGTMTFGTDWGWGSERDEVVRILDAYLERGGNFLDTAGSYTGGTSERLIGELLGPRRDRVVLATKYTGTVDPGDPNAGGNSRRSMVRAVEASLRRLDTDWIDLLYLHLWDGTTPVEEVLRGMDDLVRSGKVVYLGLSDVPAWEASRMQTVADLRGWSPIVALQIEYSLAERTVERDLVPMATELGMGVVAWSPLANGVLTGKYQRADLSADRQAAARACGTRFGFLSGTGSLTEHNLGVADVVAMVAAEIGASPAQVALAWLLRRPGVTAPLLGARTHDQLVENLGALDVVFDDTHLDALDEATRVPLGFPHEFLARPTTRRAALGDTTVRSRA